MQNITACVAGFGTRSKRLYCRSIGSTKAMVLAEADEAGEPRLELGHLDLVERHLGLGAGDLLLEARYLLGLRALQGDTAREAAAHGAHAVHLGWRAIGRIAGALRLWRPHVLDLGLDEVWQLQVLEEDVEELVLREREDEIVLAFAVGAGLAAAASATTALRLRNEIADLIVLVARQHEVAVSAVAAVLERRLAHAFRADRDALRAFDLRYLALLQRILHRPRGCRLSPGARSAAGCRETWTWD